MYLKIKIIYIQKGQKSFAISAFVYMKANNG